MVIKQEHWGVSCKDTVDCKPGFNQAASVLVVSEGLHDVLL